MTVIPAVVVRISLIATLNVVLMVIAVTSALVVMAVLLVMAIRSFTVKGEH